MKRRQFLSVFLALVMLVGLLPWTAQKARAEETATGMLVGWMVEGPSDSVKSVTVNGAELAADGEQMPVERGSKVEVVITLNEGYAFDYQVDGIFAELFGVDSGTSNLTNLIDNETSLQIPDASWTDDNNFALVIYTTTESAPGYTVEEVSEITLTVTPPVCGTDVTSNPENPFWGEGKCTPQPQVTVPGDALYVLDGDEEYNYGAWFENNTYEQIAFLGTMTGGETYIAMIYLKLTNPAPHIEPILAVQGLPGSVSTQAAEEPTEEEIPVYNVFADEISFTIEGGELFTYGIEYYNPSILWVALFVDVVHEGGEPVMENVTEPTCLEDGSHEEVISCIHCEQEISREKVTDPALGHDWGEWTLVKEPTLTEAGEEQRVCKRDPSHIETREVPALVGFTVTFETNGGTAVEAQTVESGKTAVKPADPDKGGYTFAGWYADAALTQAFDFSTAITEDITVYAEWSDNPKTGDAMDLSLWIGLVTLSLFMGGAALVYEKKRRTE